MKKPILITLTALMLPFVLSAQFGKKFKYSSIHIAASLNYYQPIEPYTFFNEYETQDRDLLLTFQTNNSGTFVIEDEIIDVKRTFTFDFPSQVLGFGMSLQILSDKSLFQELSITQLSVFKSNTLVDYQILDTMSDFRTVILQGEEQKTTVFGMRYEFGKYFGNKKSPVKFGLSAGIEPTFYRFKMIPKGIQRFPITAKITTIEISVMPTLSFKIAKKVTLDFKVISNFLVADIESVRIDDPAIPKGVNNATRNYNLPEIDLGASVVLRCQIKDAKKRPRRSRG
jgi:hypothetical protein